MSDRLLFFFLFPMGLLEDLYFELDNSQQMEGWRGKLELIRPPARPHVVLYQHYLEFYSS